MSDKEIYGLLEDVSGVKSYKSKESKALETFQKVQKEKSAIELVLGEIEDRIEQLLGEKKSYLSNLQQENYVESLQFLFYEKIREEYEEKKKEAI